MKIGNDLVALRAKRGSDESWRIEAVINKSLIGYVHWYDAFNCYAFITTTVFGHALQAGHLRELASWIDVMNAKKRRAKP